MGEPSVINTAAEKPFARVTDGCYPMALNEML
jgi:hypothetical protein